jgi:hypothetical protein
VMDRLPAKLEDLEGAERQLHAGLGGREGLASGVPRAFL